MKTRWLSKENKSLNKDSFRAQSLNAKAKNFQDRDGTNSLKYQTITAYLLVFLTWIATIAALVYFIFLFLKLIQITTPSPQEEYRNRSGEIEKLMQN